MANAVSAVFAKFWDKNLQIVFNNENVARSFAKVNRLGNLRQGQTLSRSYLTKISPRSYSRGTAVTIRDVTLTEETLTVNQTPIIPFYMDNLDEFQSALNRGVAANVGKEFAIAVANLMDGDVLGEIANADSSVDDLDVNPSTGTDNNGIEVTPSNIDKLFSVAAKKLEKATKGRFRNQYFAVLSPDIINILRERLAGKDSDLGDKVGTNGMVGRYWGFDIIEATSLYFTASLNLQTTPTDGDTVVVNGVTWTFKTTLGTTAGNVLIGANANAARTNLAKAFSNTNSAAASAIDSDAVYVELTAANRDLVDTLVGTNDASSKVTITLEGKGAVAVSETMTAAADLWTPALQVEHQFFGIKGAPELVVSIDVKTDIKPVPDKIGDNWLIYVLYGLKSFDDQDAMMCDVKVRSDKY